MRSAYPDDPRFRVGINLSAQDLTPYMIGVIDRALAAHGMTADGLPGMTLRQAKDRGTGAPVWRVSGNTLAHRAALREAGFGGDAVHGRSVRGAERDHLR